MRKPRSRNRRYEFSRPWYSSAAALRCAGVEVDDLRKSYSAGVRAHPSRGVVKDRTSTESLERRWNVRGMQGLQKGVPGSVVKEV